MNNDPLLDDEAILWGYVERAAKPPNEPKYRDNWSAEVFSLNHLIMWVADHPGNSHLLKPNLAELHKVAKAQKNLMNIAGVTAVNRITKEKG